MPGSSFPATAPPGPSPTRAFLTLPPRGRLVFPPRYRMDWNERVVGRADRLCDRRHFGRPDCRRPDHRSPIAGVAIARVAFAWAPFAGTTIARAAIVRGPAFSAPLLRGRVDRQQQEHVSKQRYRTAPRCRRLASLQRQLHCVTPRPRRIEPGPSGIARNPAHSEAVSLTPGAVSLEPDRPAFTRAGAERGEVLSSRAFE